jgi:hypothetical protein
VLAQLLQVIIYKFDSKFTMSDDSVSLAASGRFDAADSADERDSSNGGDRPSMDAAPRTQKDRSRSSSSDSSSDSSEDDIVKGRKRSRNWIASSSESDSDSDNCARSRAKVQKKTRPTQSSQKQNGGDTPSEIARTASEHSFSNYTRFNPNKRKSAPSHALTSGMLEYATEQFSTYRADSVVQDTILETAPIPEIELFAPLEMDTFVAPMLDSQKRSVEKGVDRGIVNIQHRVMQTMGPLSQLWVTLESLKNGVEDAVKNGTTDQLDQVDILQLLDLTERTYAAWDRPTLH